MPALVIFPLTRLIQVIASKNTSNKYSRLLIIICYTINNNNNLLAELNQSEKTIYNKTFYKIWNRDSG
jgi:hypothetical protein